jgi:hypothetical protein
MKTNTITVHRVIDPYKVTLSRWREIVVQEGSEPNVITDSWHRESIEQALFEKKKISRIVLSDYPDIKPINHIFDACAEDDAPGQPSIKACCPPFQKPV